MADIELHKKCARIAARMMNDPGLRSKLHEGYIIRSDSRNDLGYQAFERLLVRTLIAAFEEEEK